MNNIIKIIRIFNINKEYTIKNKVKTIKFTRRIKDKDSKLKKLLIFTIIDKCRRRD